MRYFHLDHHTLILIGPVTQTASPQYQVHAFLVQISNYGSLKISAVPVKNHKMGDVCQDTSHSTRQPYHVRYRCPEPVIIPEKIRTRWEHFYSLWAFLRFCRIWGCVVSRGSRISMGQSVYSCIVESVAVWPISLLKYPCFCELHVPFLTPMLCDNLSVVLLSHKLVNMDIL